jgi:hypothetical protein
MSALNRFLNELNQNGNLQARIYRIEKNRNFRAVGCESGWNPSPRLNLCFKSWMSR